MAWRSAVNFARRRERPSARIVCSATAGLAAICLVVTTSFFTSARAAVPGWRRGDLRPVTQPVAIGGRFVVYAASNGSLRVAALNAQTGATVWSDSASPSQTAPGEEPELVIVNGAIVYFHPVRGTVSDVAARDPASGRVLWHSQPGIFNGWPFPCPGDTTDVCVTGYTSVNQSASVLVRLNGHTGTTLGDTTLTVGRSIGVGLYDDQHGPEVLQAISGSSLSWARPLASIFTVPGASSTWGWNIDRDTLAGLFVGEVGTRPLVYTKTRVITNLAAVMTAGFRISNGATVWRDPGLAYFCTFLPCPGSSPAGYLNGTTGTAGSTVGVGIAATGTATVTETKPASVVLSAGSKIELEGFAPATGRILWHYNAGRELALLRLDLPPQVGPATVVLPATGGRLVTIDLETGESHPATATTPAWCRAPIMYHENIPYPLLNGQSTNSYEGQEGLAPCTAAGRSTPTPKTIPSFVAAIGARSDGFTAWSTATGVTAAPS